LFILDASAIAGKNNNSCNRKKTMKKSILEQFASDAINAPVAVTGGKKKSKSDKKSKSKKSKKSKSGSRSRSGKSYC
jgi:hypothetical protein